MTFRDVYFFDDRNRIFKKQNIGIIHLLVKVGTFVCAKASGKLFKFYVDWEVFNFDSFDDCSVFANFGKTLFQF